jgi:hypothetical protein
VKVTFCTNQIFLLRRGLCGGLRPVKLRSVIDNEILQMQKVFLVL